MKDFSNYEMKSQGPAKPVRPRISFDATSSIYRAHANELEKFEKAMEAYNIEHTAYLKEKSGLLNEFKKDALEEVGLTGHPAADRAWEYAADKANSSAKRLVFDELERIAQVILG